MYVLCFFVFLLMTKGENIMCDCATYICVLWQWIYDTYFVAFVIWQCREHLTLCRGEQEHLTCFISFVITCLLQGEFICRGVFINTGCHHQKGGECWSLQDWKILMMDNKVKMHLELYLKHLYFWLLNLSWRFWVFLCIFRIIVKSLEHTHKYLFSRLDL